MKIFTASRRLLALVMLTVMVGAGVSAQQAAQETGQEPGQQPAPELIYSGGDLTPGTEHAGQLQAMHPQMNDGTHADCFQLRPRAGHEYTVTLRSEDFDSFLLVGVGSCDDVLIQFENDDFEDEGLDAQLVFAAEYDLYSVYVNTYDPGATGAYTLSVDARLLPMPTAQD